MKKQMGSDMERTLLFQVWGKVLGFTAQSVGSSTGSL